MSAFHSPVPKKLGFWVSEKKSQKLSWIDLIRSCELHGYELVRLDLEKPLEGQGDIDVFLHKMTDVIAAADQNDAKALELVTRVENYLATRPDLLVIDSLDSVRILLNRNKYYSILNDEFSEANGYIFMPAFAEFTTMDIHRNLQIMHQRGVKFPVVCKPTLAHGKMAHQLTVIFKSEDLKYCKPPCVVQSFVNHNAVLHKIYLVGNRYHISQRPSLKNFYSSDYLEPIMFNSGDVCKAGSQSSLSILDPCDQTDIIITYDEEKIVKIIGVLKQKIGLRLAGIDVVVDNVTGAHAVIDINVFPSYQNFPNFFDHLMHCVDDAFAQRNSDEDMEDISMGLRGLLNISDGNDAEFRSECESGLRKDATLRL